MGKIKHAIILAAGRGTRLIPITNKVPKGLVEINNQTLILRGIKKIRNFIKNIHITVGYKGSMMAEHVIKNKVSSVINTEGKGNAWWIFNFPFNLINDPVLVLTCDNITKVNFKRIFLDYKKLGSPACMLISVKPIEGLDGDYIHQKKNKIYKLSRVQKAKTYCSGIQIVNPKKIQKLMKKKNDFNKVWRELIKKKQLYVSNIVPSRWFTIDNLTQLTFFKKNFK
jgi:NDP-sugar pyrophosphorylase family protein